MNVKGSATSPLSANSKATSAEHRASCQAGETPPPTSSGTETVAADSAPLNQKSSPVDPVLLGAIMMANMAVLWFTNNASSDEPAALAFSDQSDIYGGLSILLASALWLGTCLAIRRSSASVD